MASLSGFTLILCIALLSIMPLFLLFCLMLGGMTWIGAIYMFLGTGMIGYACYRPLRAREIEREKQQRR